LKPQAKDARADKWRSRRLSAGELVEVRSLEEILGTLDSDGTLDGLPFMPEMVEYCGRQFRVRARAERTCVETKKARGMRDAVWLEGVRCDGSAHDGCTIGCQVFFKEAWLKRPTDHSPAPGRSSGQPEYRFRVKDDVSGRYVCQSSALERATYPLGILGNLKTYVNEIVSGTISIPRFLHVIFVYLNIKILGRYGKVRPLRGNTKGTPTEILNLQPGELVEIKESKEIQQTLDVTGRNRGLSFQAEFVEFTGRRFRVLRRAERLIDESTGEMRYPKNTVILEGVCCTGTCRRGCARNGYLLWREIWLRRVIGGQPAGTTPDPGTEQSGNAHGS
jgi:hypothetical protein